MKGADGVVVAFVGGPMVSELVDPSEYDPLYLAGVVKFNECDYYECHEVWEELWTTAKPFLEAFSAKSNILFGVL